MPANRTQSNKHQGKKSNSTAQGSLKTREIHNPSVFDRYLPHFLLLQIRHNKSRQNQGFSWVPTVQASPYLPTVVCHHRPMTQTASSKARKLLVTCGKAGKNGTRSEFHAEAFVFFAKRHCLIHLSSFSVHNGVVSCRLLEMTNGDSWAWLEWKKALGPVCDSAWPSLVTIVFLHQ